MIDVIIFSKDRAMQLDLLLRSIKDNFKELSSVNIICKGSNIEFVNGYVSLSKKFPEHNWVSETNLIDDVKVVVNKFDKEYCVTFVDDEITTMDHSIKPLIDALDNDKEETIHCASLRLGRNIGDYCYTADIKATKPEFLEIEKGVFKWDWTKGDGRVDFYYPSCINSHVYRTSFLKKWINSINFGNINDLEGSLNSNRDNFKSNMICLDKSKTVNIANNLTQTGFNRHSNKQEFSLEELNNKFLSGYEINKDDFYNIDNVIATFEKDYTFKRKSE